MRVKEVKHLENGVRVTTGESQGKKRVKPLNCIRSQHLVLVMVWSCDITISFVNEFTNSLLPRISHLIILCGSSPLFRSLQLNRRCGNSGVPRRPLLYWPRLCLHHTDSLLHADLYTVYIAQMLGVLLFLLTSYLIH